MTFGRWIIVAPLACGAALACHEDTTRELSNSVGAPDAAVDFAADATAGEDASKPNPVDAGGRDAGPTDVGLDVGGLLDAGGPECPAIPEPDPRRLSIPADCPDDPQLDADIAYSPRASHFAEMAALEIDGRLYASQDRYLRTRHETCRMLELVPELIVFEQAGLNKALRPDITILVEAGQSQPLLDGTYAPARCLHAWLGLTRVEAGPSNLGPRSIGLFFAGKYAPGALARRYQTMPGVVGTMTPFRVDAFSQRMCAFDRAGIHHYQIQLGSGDCEAGCINWDWYYFTAEPDGEVTLEAFWSQPGSTEPKPSVFDPTECIEKTTGGS